MLRSRTSSSIRCSPSRATCPGRTAAATAMVPGSASADMAEPSSRAVIVVHRAVRILLLVVVPLVAVVAWLYIYATGGQDVETDNAYVKANIVPISAAVTGRVIEVLIHDNQELD